VFLVEQREAIKNMSDETFETVKNSVVTKLSEKDFNLMKEKGRFGSEISLHQYNFKRQAQDLEEIAKINKTDLQAMFEKVFFSSTSKRMDVKLTAEAHTEENAEYFTKNKEHEIFKLLERQEFKSAQAKYHAD